MQLSYWDTFTLALAEELERSGRFDAAHRRAWLDLLGMLFDQMMQGYFTAMLRLRA